ncbi:MAG TPA: hypothetical protein RMH99_06375 [Sandaracinaceae bacterium LLY-WYZ-13_1]|nr:hypothetical protein [Sandaracinaceae bacterium LLY-WYZ-13_1]
MAERDLVHRWRGTTSRCRASARRHAPQKGQVPPAGWVVESPARISYSRSLAARALLLAAVVLALGCAPDTCTEAGLAAALEGAGASGVVQVGDCEVETTGLVVPAGVTLTGTTDASAIRGLGPDPAVSLGAGARLTELVVAADDGVAVDVSGVESALLADLTIVGPVTPDNVADHPASGTASRIGLLIRDSGTDDVPVRLERVRVRGFADVGVGLVRSEVRWVEGSVSESLGAGLAVSGGRLVLASVTLRDMLQEGRLSATYAGVFLAGAEVESEDLVVEDNAGAGLMHDAASAVHHCIVVRNNALLGMWTQRAPRFELTGATSILDGNGRVGLAIHDPAGPHMVSDVTITNTRVVPRAVGMFGMDAVADGIHLVSEDTAAVTLTSLELRANLRAGALIHVRSGMIDPATLRSVTVESSGSAYGVIAQDPAGNIPSGAWDTDVTRAGAAVTNDAMASQVEILGIIAPMGLPVPPP